MIVLLNGLPGSGKGFTADLMFRMLSEQGCVSHQENDNLVMVDALDKFDYRTNVQTNTRIHHMLMKRQMLETFVSVFGLSQDEFDFYYSPKNKNTKFMRMYGQTPREFIQKYAEEFIKKTVGVEFFAMRELQRIDALGNNNKRITICSDFGSPGELDVIHQYSKKTDEDVVLIRISRPSNVVDTVETRKVYSVDDLTPYDIHSYDLVNCGTDKYKDVVSKFFSNHFEEFLNVVK